MGGAKGNQNNFKHGGKSNNKTTPEYQAWGQAKKRCECKTDKDYKRYGGRGIKMSPKWRDDFGVFLADMGERPSPKHSLDRIDTNGHYEPGNCRWATIIEQQRNRRSNVHITINGVTKIQTEWCELYSIQHDTVLTRRKAGWTIERAITEPVRLYPRKPRINETMVRKIRALGRLGKSQHAIANETGMSQSGIANILSGKAWKHII